MKEAKCQNRNKEEWEGQEQEREQWIKARNLSGSCCGIRRLHRTVAAKISVQSLLILNVVNYTLRILRHHSWVFLPFLNVQDGRAQGAFSQTLASSISRKSLCMGTLPSSLTL